jgi:hypothetical protein
MKAYHFDQIKLIAAIGNELNRQCSGLPADERFNTIIAAATSIVNEYARTPVTASKGMGLNAWLVSDDTGSSSRFMARVLSAPEQIDQHGDYPRDADDLGRCFRLIEAAPELAQNLERMKQCGPHWKLVILNWEKWKDLYESEESNKLHHAMKEAYRHIMYPL